MRILFVNEKCGFFGGVEQNIADTVEGLRARGHQCFLAYATTTDRGATTYKALFDGCFPCLELAHGQGTRATYTFEVILNRVAPDVVYIHKAADVAFCEPFFSTVRFVRMIHDHDLCCPRRHKYYLLNGRVCHHKAGWRCYLDGAFLARTSTGMTLVSIGRKLEEMRRHRRLDALLVGSRFMRQELVQNGFPEEKVHIVPPVVRLEHLQPSPLPDEPRLLYVGQLIRGKGVDLLLRALTHVRCPFTATIVGTGNAEPHLRALCHRLGLDERVHFQGWVDHDDLDRFYRAAKVVAVPSRWPEPFGMIGLEAMHHGRPVVAFAVGGIPDWLIHEVTGLLVPEQDVAAFGEAVERLLIHTDVAASYGQAALKRAQKHYSFERYLDQLETHLSGQMPYIALAV